MNQYYSYYATQAGGSLEIYSPIFQRGHGLSSMLKSLYRYVRPLIISQGRRLASSALKSGTALGQDLLEGKEIRESGKKRLREFADSAFSQKGSGKRKRRKRDIFQ